MHLPIHEGKVFRVFHLQKDMYGSLGGLTHTIMAACNSAGRRLQSSRTFLSMVQQDCLLSSAETFFGSALPCRLWFAACLH